MAFFWRLFPQLPQWITAAMAFVPWLTVFGISFCNAPPFGPRRFRHCLMFAMFWYASVTLTAETLYLLVDSEPSRHLPLSIARALMYVFGAVSSIVFIRACITLRRYEKDHAG